MGVCIYPECETPAPDGSYCGHHHWVVRAELDEGFSRLRGYLKAWADFTEWCRTHKAA